ncbi:hypothetical protein OG948_27865 [Embleya sp. NBC_00888]|uniref:hypothetical protein n=1 Tax=Embleya sp. NBC_00888 TaxID=2975960 RepID=UPI003868BC74|nr:hypothetical protein OG948_27865 [Embleya sp. NBC_00888]
MPVLVAVHLTASASSSGVARVGLFDSGSTAPDSGRTLSCLRVASSCAGAAASSGGTVTSDPDGSESVDGVEEIDGGGQVGKVGADGDVGEDGEDGGLDGIVGVGTRLVAGGMGAAGLTLA